MEDFEESSQKRMKMFAGISLATVIILITLAFILF